MVSKKSRTFASENFKLNVLKYKVMIRIQKFKFDSRFESLETKNISTVIANLKDYKRVNSNLWLSTKFVGEYAIVDFLDINGNVVKYI